MAWVWENELQRSRRYFLCTLYLLFLGDFLCTLNLLFFWLFSYFARFLCTLDLLFLSDFLILLIFWTLDYLISDFLILLILFPHGTFCIYVISLICSFYLHIGLPVFMWFPYFDHLLLLHTGLPVFRWFPYFYHFICLMMRTELSKYAW